MGKYFGIRNITKNESISSYWKGIMQCDLLYVMHQFGWSTDDIIYISSGDSMYYVYFREKDYFIVEVDILPFVKNGLYIEDETYNELKNNGITKVDIDNYLKRARNEESDNKKSHYGFDINKLDTDKTWHIPKWDGNKCVNCNHICNFDKEYHTSLFDSTFHMN